MMPILYIFCAFGVISKEPVFKPRLWEFISNFCFNNLIILILYFDLIIHLSIFNIWCEGGVKINSFKCDYLVVQAPFLKDYISPLGDHHFLLKISLPYMYEFISLLNYFPTDIYIEREVHRYTYTHKSLSVIISVPRLLEYYKFVVSFKIMSSKFVFHFEGCFGYYVVLTFLS